MSGQLKASVIGGTPNLESYMKSSAPGDNRLSGKRGTPAKFAAEETTHQCHDSYGLLKFL